MKLTSLVILVLFTLYSFQRKVAPDEIIIEGQVKNIPDGMIYLSEAHAWDTPLYTTVCSKGTFKFKIKPDSAFVPFMAAIHFPDSSRTTNVGGIVFRNHMLGADSMKYGGVAFYLEKGYTRIEGDDHQRMHSRVYAGQETDLLFRYRMAGFGGPGEIGSDKHLQRIAFIKKQIKLYPFPYFILHGIYDSKDQYTEPEIREVLSLFNPDVQKSALAAQIRTYLTNRTDPEKP